MLGETVTAARTIVSPKRTRAEPAACLARRPGFDDQGTAGELGFDPLYGHCFLSLVFFASG